MPLSTDMRREGTYGAAVNWGILYFAIGLAAWPACAILLYRIARPAEKLQLLAVAALLAFTWPVTLPLLSFAGVAIARVIRTTSRRARALPNAALSPRAVNL
jgi:hypothetical protein